MRQIQELSPGTWVALTSAPLCQKDIQMTSDVVVWCLPLEVLQTCPAGRRPRGRPWAGGITCLIYPGNGSRLPRRDQKCCRGEGCPEYPCLRCDIQLWTNRRRCGWVDVIKHATWCTSGRDNLLEAKEKVVCLFIERLLKWKDSHETLNVLCIIRWTL